MNEKINENEKFSWKFLNENEKILVFEYLYSAEYKFISDRYLTLGFSSLKIEK